MDHQRGAENPVTALIADSDPAQLHNIALYAQYQREVRLYGALSSGEAVLRALREGPCPDVLVVDAVLRGGDVFELLGTLSRLGLPRRPALLLTAGAFPAGLRQKFLTLGVDFTMLKPYRLESLFQAVVLLGARTGKIAQKQLNQHINWHMEALRANYRYKGDCYIAMALREFAAVERSVEAEEMYQRVAELEMVEKDSVKRAIQRSIQRMQAQGTEEYRAICRYCGCAETQALPNADFLFRLLQMIRQELCM